MVRVPLAVAFASLLLAAPVCAQTTTENSNQPPPVVVSVEPLTWDLDKCLAARPEPGHSCTPEHLDVDFAILISSDPNMDVASRQFQRTMAEIGMVESLEALRQASAAAKEAEQNLADFTTCLSDNYRSQGFRAFEERKQAARTAKEQKKVDREELDWFGFYGADHACTPEHWAEDWAVLMARDTAHARDQKWQKNELKRQVKAHVLHPVPLPDPTIDADARERLRHEAVLGLVERLQGDDRLKQVREEQTAAIWAAVASSITAAANSYAAAVAQPVVVPVVPPSIAHYSAPTPLPVYAAPAITYRIPAYAVPQPIYQPIQAPYVASAARLPVSPFVPTPRIAPSLASPPALIGAGGTYLGVLSSNRYDPNSVSNPYGRYGNPYSATSINNPYGKYGNPYSAVSATNPYSTRAPAIVANNGQYLGQLSTNRYSPTSVSNPYGVYGSPYSFTSITNPYGPYGSLFSPSSVTNPFAVSPIAPIAPAQVFFPKRH